MDKSIQKHVLFNFEKNFTTAHTVTTNDASADVSVRSPRKRFVFHQTRNIYEIKVSGDILFILKTDSLIGETHLYEAVAINFLNAHTTLVR